MQPADPYQEFKKRRNRWTKRVRRDLEYGFVCFFAWLGKSLGLERMQWLGRLVGNLAFHVLKKDRGIAEKNLSMVFADKPEAERQQLTRECFRNFGSLVFELFCIDQLSQEAPTRFTAHNEAIISQCHQQGKGTIVIGLHMGNWELLAPYFMHTGLPARAVVKPLYDPRLNNYFIGLRERGGIKILQRGQKGTFRYILECFKQNEFFYVLIDQDTDVPGMFVPFFNRPARTPIVAATLALKTGAPVISANVIRRENGHFDLHFNYLGTFPTSTPLPQDIFKLALEMNRHLESLILQHPSQWAWFHRRWNKQPQPEDLALLEQMKFAGIWNPQA